MGKTRSAATIDLQTGFAKTAGSREAHLNQTRVLDGYAIRDLQACCGLARGQAVAMINPARGSAAVSLRKGL